MARQKGPIPPRRRGGPDPFGHRPGAPLNREASYAPPHTFGDPAANEQGIQKPVPPPNEAVIEPDFLARLATLRWDPVSAARPSAVARCPLRRNQCGLARMVSPTRNPLPCTALERC
jgi:hypothetical protein